MGGSKRRAEAAVARCALVPDDDATLGRYERGTRHARPEALASDQGATQLLKLTVHHVLETSKLGGGVVVGEGALGL